MKMVKGDGIMAVVTGDLHRVRKDQARVAAEMLSRAFERDPMYDYFIQDDALKSEMLYYLFQLRVRYGLRYGEVYSTSSGIDDIAIWLPYENTEMTPWRLLRSGGLTVSFKLGKSIMGRITAFSEFASEIHHRHANFPHWHLSPLAVDPIFQGKGHGKKLLEGMLERVDQEHLPCFLETQSPLNVAIYEKYGFEVVEERAIPNTDLMHWAMLRPAK